MSPLIWVPVTVLTWVLASAAARRFPRVGRVANPLVVSVVAVSLIVIFAGTSYSDYAAASEPLTVLLAPGIVALALPVSRNWTRVFRFAPGVIAATLGAAITAIGSAYVLATALHVPPSALLALLASHTTSPVAFATVDGLHGPASLAAVFAISAGLLGAIAGPAVLRMLRVTDPRAAGLAMGISSHAIGTARAFEIDEVAGSFSAIGMAAAAVAVPIAVVVAARIFGLP